MQNNPYPQKIGSWWLAENLGSGYSGSIFRGINVHTNQQAAIKLQLRDADCRTNLFERSFYPALQGGLGMPSYFGCGEEGAYDYLAIELLGSSLDALLRRSGKGVMELHSVCAIAMQVIARLEYMHKCGLLHRDIQLGNCVVGLPPNDHIIYMIDFGFSKFYIDRATRCHIPESKAKRDFIGNYWFTSVKVHCRGKVPSRRDDLEAVALMLIHLLTPGGLSWTRNGVPKTDAAHERLMQEKRNARPETLCHGLPDEFEDFLRYCRRLKFAERPDYAMWIDRFRQLASDRGYGRSSSFVWPPKNPKPAVPVALQPKRPVPVNDVIEGMLRELAKLNLNDECRRVLVERNAIVNVVHQDKGNAKKPVEVIVISSDDENDPHGAPAAVRWPKAIQLRKLAHTVPDATNNAALARVVQELVGILHETHSRTLTREAFAVLDALHKQLVDPSTRVQPTRASRRQNGDEGMPQPAHMKITKLVSLRRNVAKAGSSKELAQMVEEFSTVIDKSNGRTVTKDAFGFLDGLATKLKTMA
ncbi:CK1/CK1 protein kinase [Laetiporus sulphureus 93-53]|uniref:CK1/CK1 protein kinase n=1 Tax=Laetiporus sulphureus 93-53 TaxID=1314785 RepID=A0A165HJX5_9APHY|nr:CK1/CK1 protein kinase [Laetiporus sulphureus 93-53]KZT11826.1 CK1/CK1 protein kinase [Laetiporus sulphureus 93-53]